MAHTKKINNKRNNFDAVWNLRNKTRKKQESAFILETEGVEIKDPEKIKNTVSEYYDDLYINNPITEGYEKYNEELEKLIKLIWKIKDKDEETDLEEEIIIKVIKNLETKKATGPDGISNDMVLEGGNSLKNSIIRMMKIIYRTEEIPKDWNAAYIKIYIKEKEAKNTWETTEE